MTAPEPGKLYLVATPIGNLGDITMRALETLRNVSVILAEDTRRTRALLTHFGIKKPLLHFDAHAGTSVAEKLVERLLSGDDAALVTDAGTPGVSDPGALLVSEAHARGVVVVPIPGVSAVTAAVAVSGLVEGPFVFLGFPARSGKKRDEYLQRVVRSPEPVVLFESPRRMAATLTDLAKLAPERRAVLCRELTKMYEEISRATLAELAARDTEFVGELTLVIEAAPERAPAHDNPADFDAEILHRLDSGESPRTIVDALVTQFEGARRELYRRVTELQQGRRGDGA